MTTQPRFLIFVSHATKDSALALRVADILDSLNLPAFVYEKYRIAGQNRFEVIKERISECPYFLVVLTKTSRKSQWVNQEIGFAAAKDKEIIPLVEVSDMQRKRIPNYGFAELHDPLDLIIDEPQHAIGELLRTLMEYAKRDNYWRRQIRLRCACGWNAQRSVRDLGQWEWDCPSCEAKISHSPLTFEPLPQEQ